LSTNFNPEVLRDWLARRAKSRPFLRWAGGKQPFLARHSVHFPNLRGAYIEPFLGSAAVFFYFSRREPRPFRSVLGDANLQLIRTYLDVRDRPAEVAENLAALRDAYFKSTDRAKFYYDQRDIYNRMLPGVDASRFIFLNRTCWNGLYRVNLNGKFNVPHGIAKVEVTFPSEDDLMTTSAALQQTEIRAASWRTTLNSASAGDFVFLDPPYWSDLEQSSKYSRANFSREEHFSVGKACVSLINHGVDFLLTNSGDAEVIKYYKSLNLSVEEIAVPRFINSKSDMRLPAAEIIVRPPEKGSLRLPL